MIASIVAYLPQALIAGVVAYLAGLGAMKLVEIRYHRRHPEERGARGSTAV